MKTRQILPFLFALLYCFSVLAPMTGAASAADGGVFETPLQGAGTDNLGGQNYSLWSSVVRSYLTENADGTLLRAENLTGADLLLETYSADGTELLSSRTIEGELPLFGGFFAGADHYYIVYGQNNPEEDDGAEVLRVVRYDGAWNRTGSASVYGANTYEPFEAGSLRMTEAGGKLFIHTCHTMYASPRDGFHHQANMTYVIDETAMTVTQSYYGVMNIAQAGYVSHSFNQFILTDGEKIYRIDHGDAYPRGIAVTAAGVNGPVTDVSYVIPVSFTGAIGNNATGASLGGAALAGDRILIAGNTDDGSSESHGSTQRNIFLLRVGKNMAADGAPIMITDYQADDSVKVYTPQLVALGGDSFLLLWQEYRDGAFTATKAVTVNGSGEKTSPIRTLYGGLSDCQPILTADGRVTWYAGRGGASLYKISPEPDCSHPGQIRLSAQEPTCTADGEEGYLVCRDCGEILDDTSDPLPATGHAFGDWMPADEDRHQRVCKNDPAHIEEGYHSWDDGVLTQPPSCEEDGMRTFTCTVCGAEKTEPIPATGHDYGDWAPADENRHQRICANDPSHVETGEHLWTDGAQTKPATCEEDGELLSVCYLCGAERTEPIPATGHDFSGWLPLDGSSHQRFCYHDSAHTQTQPHNLELIGSAGGVGIYRCADCGYEKTALLPTEPAAETTEPTAEPTEPISDPTEPISEPTEPTSEPDEPTTGSTEPTAGSTEPAEGQDQGIFYDVGDVTMDGKVNATDARAALRASARLDQLTPLQTALADADGDGRVKAGDARMILRVAARLDPKPDARVQFYTAPSGVAIITILKGSI